MAKSEDDPFQLRFPELIDPKALAKMLGVSERYVRRMIQERRVGSYKVGKLVRFDLAEVCEYIKQQKRPATDRKRPGRP